MSVSHATPPNSQPPEVRRILARQPPKTWPGHSTPSALVTARTVVPELQPWDAELDGFVSRYAEQVVQRLQEGVATAAVLIHPTSIVEIRRTADERKHDQCRPTWPWL